MKKLSMLCVVAVSMVAATGASAATGGAVYGAGNVGCGKWVQARTSAAGEATVAVFTNWILGYVTGAETTDEVRQYGPIDLPGVQSSMDIYCKAHPSDTIMKGARSLVLTLRTSP
jgi:hypothetical protein